VVARVQAALGHAQSSLGLPTGRAGMGRAGAARLTSWDWRLVGDRRARRQPRLSVLSALLISVLL
jgi:hypothetical protein